MKCTQRFILLVGLALGLAVAGCTGRQLAPAAAQVQVASRANPPARRQPLGAAARARYAQRDQQEASQLGRFVGGRGGRIATSTIIIVLLVVIVVLLVVH